MQLPDPQKKIWRQLNTSDTLGDLWATFNIDLTENEGKLRLGDKVVPNTLTTGEATLTSYPIGFKLFINSKFTAAGTAGAGYVFTTVSNRYPSGGPFTRVTASNSPTDIDSALSDMVVSNDTLYVTSPANANNVYYTTDGTTWAKFAAGASATQNPQMLCAYGGRTYMSRAGSSIISWDIANTIVTSGQYTLQLPNTSSNNITFMEASSTRIWIGVTNTLGGRGRVYEWDGVANTVAKFYVLDAQGALACVIKDDVPYIMDSNGNLLYWNGGTFKKLGGVNKRRSRMLFNATSSTNNRFVHPRGISVVTGRVNVMLDGRNMDGAGTQAATSIEETIPSGIYEYDDGHGFYHKYSINPATVGGLFAGYGQAKIAGAGGLSEINPADSTNGRDGTLLVGASYFTNSSTASGIFYDDSNDTLQRAGYFVTTKQYPQPGKDGYHITELWKKLFINYKKLLGATDKIVVKYRATEVEPTEVTIGWQDSTHVTTSGDLSTYVVGDEMEVISGQGAGFCAHITAISFSSGSYTVAIDQSITNTGGALNLSQARFQKWTKMMEISDQTSTWSMAGFPTASGVPLASSWVQFKVWMIFTGRGEIELLTTASQANQLAQ